MDWMFKEDAGNEGSSCMNNQSSTHTSKNTGDNSFTLMNESKDIVHNVDEDVVSIGSTILEHEEECAEDSSSTVSPNAQIDETLRSVDSERMQGTEGVHDLTNISSQEDGQDVDVNLNSGVPENSLEEKADEECKCDSDKDKTIKLLREEVQIHTLTHAYSSPLWLSFQLSEFLIHRLDLLDSLPCRNFEYMVYYHTQQKV